MAKLSPTRKMALGELGAFRNGVNFSKDQMGSGLKLINVKDIFGDSPWIDFENLDLVDLGDKGRLSVHTVDQDDLFFVRSSVKRDGIGLVRLANSRRKDAVHCGFVIRFRLNNKETNALFLTYLLRSPGARQRIINLSGGSAIINISQSALASLTVDLPSLSTQRRIAAILSAYDDLIDNNLQRIRILEEMAQNLYREWFVKFRFPGHQHARFTDSPLGRIPEGWEVKGAMDNSNWSFIGQNVQSYKGSKRYYATADIDGITIAGEGIDYTFREKPSRAQKQPLLNSVWFARMQETYKVLAVAKPNATLAANAMLSSGFAGFEASDEESFAFLFLTVESTEFHLEKDRYCTGATQRSLTNDGLSRILTICPPREVVRQFGCVATSSIELILSLQQRNQVLRRTRDLLLPRLVSGELDVSALDITIPEGAEA